MSSTEMKSYLSLIPISAKVRRRQNRMTILCIVLAVFLVTAVFSMADMAIRMETSNQLNKNGNWHIMVKDISPETAAELAAQEDVAAFSAYSDINASLTENYFAGDKRAALVGADDAILQIFPGMQCSTAPADGEVLVTANIRDWLDVTVGTAIPLTLPDGQTISLTVAGFNEDTSDANQYDAVVLVMNRSTFSQIAAQVEESFETQYFIQFKPRTNLRQSIVNIENKYGISEEKISENTYLMALNASSNNDYIVGLYAVAAVLAGMVVLAGIFMITGSINSNVAQRTSYYGMLRCLGAGKNQVRMLVRLEALFWCKTAVPAGCVLGIVSTWGLCSFLRGFIGEEFSSLPVLGISPVGIICGSALGLITVWFAASSPARRAAKASPITAATGNAVENAADSPCHARLFGSRAELSLGVSHATSSKKNLLLMTGSFALSILLFLSFSVLLRWVGFALNPVQSYAPDLSVAETSGQNVLDPVLVEQLEALPEVKHAFGRMYCPLPAEYQGKQGSIDLISYDTIQFGWAK
ncbi:MAG: ABC transporter permease, partial [Gemmiger qucibialis]